MPREFKWPATGRRHEGGMGFPSTWDEHTASDYKGWLQLEVEKLLRELEEKDAQLSQVLPFSMRIDAKIGYLREAMLEHDRECAPEDRYGGQIDRFLKLAAVALADGGQVHVRLGEGKKIEYSVSFFGGKGGQKHP